MAAGRAEGKVVRDYLEALQANRPKRGRRRTPDSIRTRLAAIEAEMEDASPIDQLKLVSERMHLDAELMSLEAQHDISELEAEFIKIAASWSDRNNIAYHAWRELGVSAPVLKSAGIPRTN